MAHRVFTFLHTWKRNDHENFTASLKATIVRALFLHVQGDLVHDTSSKDDTLKDVLAICLREIELMGGLSNFIMQSTLEDREKRRHTLWFILFVLSRYLSHSPFPPVLECSGIPELLKKPHQ